MELAPTIKITRRKLRSVVHDHQKAALAADLVYVTDKEPGIIRKRRGKDFSYHFEGKQVKDPGMLKRIKALVIPPAWENVWICTNPDGHLQVTGTDIRNRKQYKYHPLWHSIRSQTKYFHLHDFGKALPAIRKQLQKDLARQGLPQEKVLAAVVSLMQCTCIRVGNSIYEKLNGSFGLTTLKDQHVSISGQQLVFSFKGKKGIYHNISLKSRKLARIVQACRDIPGKELFQYYEGKERKTIDSGMVNSYIKVVSGGNFTAKDFRTWAGTLHALRAINELNGAGEGPVLKKDVVEVIDRVAKQLGNTRTVCRKYYIHPAILDGYASKKLDKYLKRMDEADCDQEGTDLSGEEKVLMRILGSGVSH